MISIFIPVYSRKETQKIIDQITSCIDRDHEIILLNIIEKNISDLQSDTVKIIRSSELGSAFFSAVQKCSGDVICYYPCSSHIDPRIVLKLHMSLCDDADIVVSRIRHGTETCIARALYYLYVTTVHFWMWIPYFETANPFILKKEVVTDIFIESKSHFFTYELLYKSLRSGYAVREVNMYGKYLHLFKRTKYFEILPILKDMLFFRLFY